MIDMMQALAELLYPDFWGATCEQVARGLAFRDRWNKQAGLKRRANPEYRAAEKLRQRELGRRRREDPAYREAQAARKREKRRQLREAC